MTETPCDAERAGRRRFLAQVAAAAAASGLAAGAAASAAGVAAPAAAAGTSPPAAGAAGESAAAGPASAPAPLPTIALGPHRITRLVAGWNPIGGYSYLGPHTDRHMKDYFTPERTVQFLLDCERAGILAHQFSVNEKTAEVLRTARERGSKMLLIGLDAGRDALRGLIETARPIAMVHHGGVTDRLFAEGKAGEVHDYVKAAHDGGVLAGVSAHNPDCIRRIADEGWEVDLFMTCFYFLTRPHAGPDEMLHVGYPFRAADPEAMTAVVRQVKQPCLGFKILAAGRRCGSEDAVQAAFRYAFEHIKPTDGVIVGMYPRFFDEITANARYAREWGGKA